RRRRRADQPGRLRAHRSARGRGRSAATDGKRRGNLVRTHVEHRPRRAQGADRRGRVRYPARADRHPALPQPPEQPVSFPRCEDRGGALAPPLLFGLVIWPVNEAVLLRLTVPSARFAVIALGRKLIARFSASRGGSMRGLARISCLGVLLACGCGLSAVVAAPACAQGSYSPYNETPAAALARYVRALADDPKAAAGFFARADDVDSTSPAPQEGMGAVQVANGDAKGALPYFTRAQKLGATQAMLGCDRGLAYDMLGEQTKAQADYRAALSGADADEARRRLALSLAIGGNKSAAIAAIAPLAAKGDPTTSRVRAFVLALTGDPNGAMAAVDAAMPGSWSRVAPFLQRLAS